MILFFMVVGLDVRLMRLTTMELTLKAVLQLVFRHKSIPIAFIVQSCDDSFILNSLNDAAQNLATCSQ